MAHECFKCGNACYCHGSIDDVVVDNTPPNCDGCGCFDKDDDSYGMFDDDDIYFLEDEEVPATVPGPDYKVVVWFTETYDTGWKNCICSLCHGSIPQGQVPLRFWSKEHEHYPGGIEMVVCETCRPTLEQFGGDVDYTKWVGLVIEPGSLDEFCENMERHLKDAASK